MLTKIRMNICWLRLPTFICYGHVNFARVRTSMNVRKMKSISYIYIILGIISIN